MVFDIDTHSQRRSDFQQRVGFPLHDFQGVTAQRLGVVATAVHGVHRE